MKKKILYGIAILFVISGVALGLYKHILSVGPVAENTLDAPRLSPAEMDTKITDVFAGKITRGVSQKTVASHQEFQYEVEVMGGMPYGAEKKGDVKGVVIISSARPLRLSEGGTVGEVFYTAYNEYYRWYEVIDISIYENYPVDPNSIQSNNQKQTTGFPKRIAHLDGQYAADFSDDKILLGASHNVFIGKVVRQIGNKERGIGPETQFQVTVIDNIKGDLHGAVTVDQQGGYKDGTLYVVGEEATSAYLLQPGSTYLFATRYNPTEDWYMLNSYPTASKLLSANTGASDASLKGLAEADLRVQQLKAAYPHEVLIDADIAHNNTRNSFESVQAAKVQ